ncbi:hypothetical protein N7492_000238 [Penicillium capsulatum]|uniref:DUF1772-domain-containing protein n=1 Tax=Penicillium capsulatum TaxID=69766 RepID=A0A9W9IRG4_9EURO|nr:hypothetical protein N7492_000238 [Penicillium capsulatum]KAJ6130696.1 hypothetical protein N7512_003476 [Penicillium capsulatum]
MAYALYHPLLAVCISLASCLTGCQFSLSFVSVTSILNAPETPELQALTIWKSTFKRGFYCCPPQAFLATGLFLLNALLTKIFSDPASVEHKSAWPLVVGALLAIALVPFTLTWIEPIEKLLLNRYHHLSQESGQIEKDRLHGDGAAAKDSEQSRELMKRWISLNYTRTTFGAMTLLWAWLVCW